ncbi:endolytic transglycosylase MltG [Agrococcus sp. ARC_14]|uniref:endolytic transglycosylase MltG n=1 Tax=Agrococcus sp. ARC_14 TaxID=2919927 RepID=UPI001F060EFA|nr:endolytic transglycosylase MltG [Agrococcus sp. ARC_14]MCH1883076.1 endolytic transglycosylase MltG [Agrococcus sp. ARC_14]
MAGRRARVQAERKRRGRRRLIGWGIALVVLIGLGIAAAWGIGQLQERFAAAEDYPGPGTGEVVVQVQSGENGYDVAATLVEEDVIASAEAFTDILVADPTIQLHPGAYRVQQQMSAQGALDAILDPANKVELRVTVPEGYTLPQVFERLERDLGIPQAEFLQLAGDPSQFDVPDGALTIEGWLFPATYTFDDGATAQSVLETMIARQHQALEQHGVAPEDAQRVLTFAALVQREARFADDFGRVAQVFQNRLDINMPLQSDATVAYGTGNLHVVTTTADERADASNPYNTYQHTGLPVGPIGAPGDQAIQAVLSPTDGPWLYFVTINPETGETVFSETYAEHQVAVQEFQQFLRDNPGWGG